MSVRKDRRLPGVVSPMCKTRIGAEPVIYYSLNNRSTLYQEPGFRELARRDPFPEIRGAIEKQLEMVELVTSDDTVRLIDQHITTLKATTLK